MFRAMSIVTGVRKLVCVQYIVNRIVQTVRGQLVSVQILSIAVNHVKMGKPIMGVCLGMQLFFEKSQEFGNHHGLGLIKGEVIKFRKNSKFDKVPQIGWNRIKFKKDKENKFFNGLSSINYMYFVHSFYVVPTKKKVVFSTTH